MKNVIITGCAGQTGSYLAEEFLLKTDYNVIGLSTGSNLFPKNLVDCFPHSERFNLDYGDISDKERVEYLVKKYKPEIFVNLAALCSVVDGESQKEKYTECNTNAVAYQLEALVKYAPDCKYLNAGSSEEFGNSYFDDEPATELTPLAPNNHYAYTKAKARDIVNSYKDKINCCQPWLFNHESVRRGKDFLSKKVAMKAAELLIHPNLFEYIPLEIGNTCSKRDWSYAGDIACGLLDILSLDKLDDYILASGELKSVANFIEASYRAVGAECKWTFVDGMHTLVHWSDDSHYPKGTVLAKQNPKFIRDRDTWGFWGDITKARNDIGYDPMEFESTVKLITRESVHW